MLDPDVMRYETPVLLEERLRLEVNGRIAWPKVFHYVRDDGTENPFRPGRGVSYRIVVETGMLSVYDYITRSGLILDPRHTGRTIADMEVIDNRKAPGA